jgi:hypothetical protein
MFASLSQEQSLIDAFKNNIDVHSRTAALVFNVKDSEVTKEQRQKGKTLNFSILYGASKHKIAEMLKITVEDAEELLRNYWQKLPMVQSFIQGIHASARRYSYADTYFGRKRHLHDIRSIDYGLRGYNERQAVSQKCQGSAADLIKIALVRLYSMLKTEGLKSKPCLTVHDEIVVAHHPNDDIHKVREVIREAMEIVIEGWAPIKADIDYGKNWKDVSKEPFNVDQREQSLPSLELPGAHSVLVVRDGLSVPLQAPTIEVSPEFLETITPLLDKHGGSDYLTFTGNNASHRVSITLAFLLELHKLGVTYTLNKFATQKLLNA